MLQQSNTPSQKNSVVEKMAEWTDAQIRILIDERRNRNDEFHDLGRDRKSFWNSIAVKINRETGTSFNGHQCKEKFSNLVRDYNAMCNFMSGKSKARSRTGARYFDEFRTHFWERPDDEFDRVRSINTFNQRRSRGRGNITPSSSTREVERELRSSERRLSRSQSPISRRQSPNRRQTVSPPLNLDNMDISDTEHERRNDESPTHQPPPPPYYTATSNAQVTERNRQ